jgi:rifampicin phosphotransferase
MDMRSIDTDPHPVFKSYSAGNFAEVAPERLSIVSWSLVGPPQERAMRALGSRLWPRSTWHSGSHFVFVGYFGCRPFHNLSALCHMAEQVPQLTSEDFTASYFEDAAPPARTRGLDEPRTRRLAAVPRLVREVGTLRPRLTELQAEVVRLEALARTALAASSALALGEAFLQARDVLDRAWALHMIGTASLPALTALQRTAGERLVPYWDELEPWLNRPGEVVWTSLHTLRGLAGDLGPAEFLELPFYEVADDRSPWTRFARPAHAVDAVSHEPPTALDPAAAFWEMPGHGGSRPLRALTRLVSDTMACRELSKSLTMRVLHVLRRLLPPISALQGLADEDWPYLTVEEIARAHRVPALAERAAARRAECAHALAEPLPDRLEFAGPPPLDLRRNGAPPERRGRGISGGTVTGVAVDATLAGSRPGEPMILVTPALDAGVQPLLRRVGGVLSARGSRLSHVAILVREQGIPAVVGHPLAAELAPGDGIALNGSTGEVTRLDA